jgi:hypothetical protein
MPTKKKTTPETESAVKAAPAAKKKTVRTATAATHKGPARKSTAKPAAKAAAAAAAAGPVEVASFDVTAHHGEIEQEAYFLFVNRGGQHGHEHADWLRAIEIVKARY